MNFEASAGGADRYFRGLLSGLDDLGVPYLAAAFGQSAEDGPSVSRRISLGPPAAPLSARWRALRRFGKRAFSESPTRLLAAHFALYAAPLALLRNAPPLVAHFHGSWAAESAAEGEGRIAVTAKALVERYVLARARRCIVLSNAYRELLTKSCGVAGERITVIPGGVDTERFSCPRADRVALRRHLGWPEDKRILLCVRRLARRMGLEELLKAWAWVARAHPDAHLVIAGKGVMEKPLREMAAALGLEASVQFVGFLPEACLPLAYAASDVSLVPSQTLEGFGLVTLESLACGTPVLVTPVGGLPEAVSGLAPSLVLPGADAGALADGLEYALRGGLPSSEACRAYAESFAWRNITRRVLAVYEGVSR